MKTQMLMIGVLFAVVCTAAASGRSSSVQPLRADRFGSAAADSPNIIYVNNASSAGAFATVIKNGFQAACREYPVSCTYVSTKNTTFDPSEEARLIDAAVAKKPAGLIVTDSSPKVLNPHIRAAVLAGIPVIINNSGLGQAGAPTGALTYVGNDEYQSGQLAGQLLADTGVKNLLVIAVHRGLALADQRLAGVLQAFHGAGKVTTIKVALADLANATKVRNIISATLSKNSAIDGVFSIGQLFNAPMLAARSSLGARAARIRWTSIDLGPEAVNALQHNQMDFALDQQQWLQGYLPVEFLYFYIHHAFTPPSPFIRTGPGVITPRTIGKYIEGVKRGIR